jgi:hypothetical protein
MVIKQAHSGLREVNLFTWKIGHLNSPARHSETFFHWIYPVIQNHIPVTRRAIGPIFRGNHIRKRLEGGSRRERAVYAKMERQKGIRRKCKYMANEEANERRA